MSLGEKTEKKNLRYILFFKLYTFNIILKDEVSWNVPLIPQYLWEVEAATQAFSQNIENKARENAAIKDIHFNPVGAHLKT